MQRLTRRSMSAVAITTLVLGACTGVGSPTGSRSPSAVPTQAPPSAPPTASAAVPTSSPSQPAALPGARWAWTQTDTPLLAATAGGPGWVLVGHDVPAADPSSQFHVPAAWTSVDARTWARAQVALPSGASHGEITVVAQGPGSLVAAGTVGLTVGTVWRSVDGRAWEVIGTGSLFDLGPCYEGCARMTSIAAGPAAIVVSGYRSTALGAHVWASADGTAWQRVTLPAPAGSGIRVGSATSVTATSSGFVAVGSVCRSDGTGCWAATWTSANGVDWRGPTDLPSGTGGGALRAVVGGNRTVILGQRCVDGCRYTAWSSTDDATWTVGDLLEADVASLEYGLIAFAGDRFLAIGSRGTAVEVWSSADGLTWQELPVEPGSFVTAPTLLIVDLAGRADAALAAGFAGADERPGVWTSP